MDKRKKLISVMAAIMAVVMLLSVVSGIIISVAS